jgi:hypothetical protein
MLGPECWSSIGKGDDACLNASQLEGFEVHIAAKERDDGQLGANRSTDTSGGSEAFFTTQRELIDLEPQSPGSKSTCRWWPCRRWRARSPEGRACNLFRSQAVLYDQACQK